MLAVHGYTDYFFHTEVADHFADRGFAFYALDLQKCGRSRREGQTPHFITDLAHYDTELERALGVIARGQPLAEDPGVRPLRRWADRVAVAGPAASPRRDAGAGVGGLVLNSPFLDLQGPAVLRLRVTAAAIGALSRVRTKGVARAHQQGRLRHQPAP